MTTRYYADVIQELSEMEKLDVPMPSDLRRLVSTVKRNAPQWEQGGLSVSEAASLALELS